MRMFNPAGNDDHQQRMPALAVVDDTRLPAVHGAVGSIRSSDRAELQVKIRSVFESAARLRATLQRYEDELMEISLRIEGGEPAISAMAKVIGPLERRRVTEAIGEFEAARRKLRVAFLTHRRNDRATIADVAEALGISPRLASRLITEERNR